MKHLNKFLEFSFSLEKKKCEDDCGVPRPARILDPISISLAAVGDEHTLQYIFSSIKMQ